MLAESAALCGAAPDKATLYETLFRLSLQGAPDCGGIASVNYISGEGVTHFDAGIPLLLRRPDSNFSLANFMRAQICLGNRMVGAGHAPPATKRQPKPVGETQDSMTSCHTISKNQSLLSSCERKSFINRFSRNAQKYGNVYTCFPCPMLPAENLNP